LSDIQTRIANALDAIFDWCAAHQGPGMQAVKGQLLFADPADLAKFESLRLAAIKLADEEDQLDADTAAWREKLEQTQKRAAADAAIYLNK
jgi:hypothetical protein